MYLGNRNFYYYKNCIMKKAFALFFQPSPILRVALILIAICTFPVGTLYAQESTKLPDEYRFKLGITYEISSGKNNNLKKSQDINMWYSEAGYTGVGMGNQTAMFMVYDMKSMKMITLMEAQKMAMTMDMKKIAEQAVAKTGATEKDAGNVKITKTGKTEKILGYACEQYRISSDKSESLVWVTGELGSGFGNYAQSMAMAMGGGKAKKGLGFPDMKGVANGIMLKMEATDPSTGDVMRMEATSVNKDGKKINISGYTMMNMPGQ
jgi:hypothetical protein